jgi:hypothetical protein
MEQSNPDHGETRPQNDCHNRTQFCPPTPRFVANNWRHFLRKPQIKNIDYGKLTPAGCLFLDPRQSIGGNFEITRIDLGRYPDGGGGRYHDDLRFPFVMMQSKIPMSKRMRRYGVQSVGYGNDSGRRGPKGDPIPTEDYIAALVRCYGDRPDSRCIDLAPYAARVVRGRMSLEGAVNAAGETILHLMEAEFEVVEG